MKKILVINNAEAGINEFSKPIEDIIQKEGFESTTLEYQDCLKFNFDSFSGIIMTGSPQGDDIIEHHLPYFRWIKDFEKPVLGICAGHHITGFLYGAEIYRSKEPESGDFFVDIVKEDLIFKGIPKQLKVKQMHNDSISLPNQFYLLATSKTCKNQLMKHKSKPLYSCQFHPEFYNQKLIQNFIKLCIKFK